MKVQLNDSEKREFYRDGFFVLKNVIPEEYVMAAQQRYKSAKRGDDLTYESVFTDLVNKTSLTPIMRELMGEFDPPSGTRHIVRPKGQKPGENYGMLGYKDKDIPYYEADLHIDGQAVRSCVFPAIAAQGKQVNTVETLGSKEIPHALQTAWLKHQVPQCGYCQSGMLMAAAALLKNIPNPSNEDIDTAMTNICRCGTYSRVKAAILDAAKEMSS